MRRIAACGLMLLLISTHVLAEATVKKLKPVVVWSGTDSAHAVTDFDRCHSQSEWDAIWKKHLGVEADKTDVAVPQVDFDDYMVVVIFHGESSMNNGIRIAEVLEEATTIRVRYKPIWYQIGFLPESESDRAKLQTCSFAFVLLPASKKKVVFEENGQSLIGGEPKWEGRAQIVILGK